MTKLNKIYENITNTLIDILEKGAKDEIEINLFWVCLGQFQGNFEDRSYNGINAINLNMVAFMNDYEANTWLTFNKIKELGGKLKKGSKATPIIYAGYKKTDSIEITDEKTGEQVTLTSKPNRFHKYFNVFNAEDVEGLDASFYQDKKLHNLINTNEPIEKLEEIINPFRHKIKFGFDKAFYRPSKDKIAMPYFEQFPNAIGFYRAIFHELSHLTGHETRLDRKDYSKDTNTSYAFEELVAELSTSFILGHLGYLNITKNNNAEYLSMYLREMKKDPKFLIKAASQAQKAADYILNQEEPV